MVLCESTDGTIQCHYCTPIDVCKAIRIIDFYDVNGDILNPSDSSLPDYDELCFRISVAERYIDKYTGRTWRENRSKNEVHKLARYWHDLNGRRFEYWARGGYMVQLNRNVLPWDPSKGDKLEYRNLSNEWLDITNSIRFVEDMEKAQVSELDKNSDWYRGWIDAPTGRLFIRMATYFNEENSIRITYRYGEVEEVPPDIRRATALKVGLTLLDEELYMTRIGTGGDLGGAKNDLKRSMQDQINETIMANRTFTPVFSLLR